MMPGSHVSMPLYMLVELHGLIVLVLTCPSSVLTPFSFGPHSARNRLLNLLRNGSHLSLRGLGVLLQEKEVVFCVVGGVDRVVAVG